MSLAQAELLHSMAAPLLHPPLLLAEHWTRVQLEAVDAAVEQTGLSTLRHCDAAPSGPH